MSDYILGAGGSMDIARILMYMSPRDMSYPEAILSELIAISKEIITDIMNDLDAIPSEWRFTGTRLESVLNAKVDVYEVWRVFQEKIYPALRHQLEETDALQQQVSKILELMPKERDD